MHLSDYSKFTSAEELPKHFTPDRWTEAAVTEERHTELSACFNEANHMGHECVPFSQLSPSKNTVRDGEDVTVKHVQ